MSAMFGKQKPVRLLPSKTKVVFLVILITFAAGQLLLYTLSVISAPEAQDSYTPKLSEDLKRDDGEAIQVLKPLERLKNVAKESRNPTIDISNEARSSIGSKLPKVSRILAKSAEDCWSACSRSKLVCDRTRWREVNHCEPQPDGFDRFKSKSVQNNPKTSFGLDLPALRTWVIKSWDRGAKECFLRDERMDESELFTCSGAFQKAERICPCIPKENEGTISRSEKDYWLDSKLSVAEGFLSRFFVRVNKYPQVDQWFPYMKLESVVIQNVSEIDGSLRAVYFIPFKAGRTRIMLDPSRNEYLSINVLKTNQLAKLIEISGTGLHASFDARNDCNNMDRINMFTAVTKNHDGTIRTEGGDEFFTAQLTKISGNPVVRQAAVIAFNKQTSAYEFTYRIADPGVYKLEVFYLDHHVFSSQDIDFVQMAQCPESQEKAVPQCSESQAAKMLLGRWVDNIWKPFECEFFKFSKSKMEKCLAKHRTAVSGDSHMREVFVAMIGEIDSRWLQLNYKFQMDKMIKVTENVNTTFWWANSVFLSMPELKEPLSKANSPDVIFMAQYLADYGSYYRGVHSYANAALLATDALFARYPNVKIVWHLPHTVHPKKSHRDWRILNSWGQQRNMRNALKLALARHPLYQIRLHVLDPWELTRARIDASGDGNHYGVSDITRMKAQIFLNIVCEYKD